MIAGHESAVEPAATPVENRKSPHCPRGQETAMMFPELRPFPHLSALGQVAFSLKMRASGNGCAP